MQANSPATFIIAVVKSLLATLLIFAPFARAGVSLPEENFESSKRLQAVLLEIRQQSYTSAAPRVQELFDRHAPELCRVDDDTLASVSQCFTAMSAAERAGLTTAVNARYDEDAGRAIESVVAKADFRPQNLYAVAKRYTFTSSAGRAYAAAADRAIDQGDLNTARVCYELAGGTGWRLSSVEQSRMNALAPTHATPAGVFGVPGLLPFDAPWFNLASGFEADKLVPVGATDLAVIASADTVLGFKPDGIVAWRYQTPQHAQDPRPRYQPGSTGRGLLSVPALLSDPAAKALSVVVSQSTGPNQNRCLSCFRFNDGRLLWSTENDPRLAATSFLGSPAVAGRYAISVAIETLANDLNSGSLQLLAVDVTNGRVLWKTQLAGVSSLQSQHELDLYRDQSPPAVVGDCVVVSPNVGAVFAVDRFDGQIRWVRSYRRTVIADGAIHKFIDQRNRGRELIAPLAWVDLLRWHCTPHVIGGNVIVAPQDTAAVLGLDLTTGRQMWGTENLPQATPVGVVAGRLLMSGATVTAVDAATGLKVWTFTPVDGMRLTGPAVVRGDEILVRSTAGLLSISPVDGSYKSSASRTDFHPAAAAEAGKAALAGNGMINAFGIPAARTGDR